MTGPVIGLDLSLEDTGVASTAGWCDRVGRSGVTTLPLDKRLAIVDELAAEILTLVALPRLVVIEAPAMSRAGGGAIERHALWWLVVRSLWRRDVPVAEVMPSGRAKYATGKGNAGKTEVVDAAARRWPDFRTRGNDNLVDAVVLAAMGADHLGSPLTDMPKANRSALDGVKWPDVPDLPPDLVGGSTAALELLRDPSGVGQ